MESLWQLLNSAIEVWRQPWAIHKWTCCVLIKLCGCWALDYLEIDTEEKYNQLKCFAHFCWIILFLSFRLLYMSWWRRQWHPTPVLLPGKSHRRRSLAGCSPWGREESDTTERLPFHFSLSCIGEGNGNPLQCSCLENPRDSRAWWAAVCGVAQSQTRLRWLSSNSSVCPGYKSLIRYMTCKYFSHSVACLFIL